MEKQKKKMEEKDEDEENTVCTRVCIMPRKKVTEEMAGKNLVGRSQGQDVRRGGLLAFPRVQDSTTGNIKG